MRYRNILVAYNGGAASRAALEIALEVAARDEAHLTGVLAHGASQFTQQIPSWLVDSLRSSLTDIMDARIEEITRSFREAVSDRLPETMIHWHDIRAEPDIAVSRVARLHDLTVVGQYENLLGADELALHPDRIAYATGGPVLLVPRSTKLNVLDNDTAVVAWDGGRRSARAFFDAMPLLRKRGRVILATVRGRATTGVPENETELLEVLGRYGLKLDRAHIAPDGTTAETLLKFCAKEGAGALVMGAYEHSRWSEDLIGGVTRDLAEISDVPIFMSH